MTYARHYFDAADPVGPTACGGNSYGFGAVANRFDAEHPVTCKRCLASLAKRDRAFQRKARDFMIEDYRPIVWVLPWGEQRELSQDAARAIAREEGRAL